ncbi:MAG: ligase [Thermodesulfobacteriota bacterium]|nr:ligase [Thermodesulfobacteriota bacterium]
MKRKLASVQRVLEIRPIEQADLIELVKIQGWQCVTKKGEFRVGDLGVYLEVDAIPPDTETFQFLWQPRAKPDPFAVVAPLPPQPRPPNFHIRTVKLRGVLSQGLFLPLHLFSLGDVHEGDDVTERLGVEKYEPPQPTHMGDRRGRFPPMIPKTDEIRVQSAPQVIEELRGHPYIITLKVDGTSGTFCINPLDGEFHVCGRTQSIKPNDNIYWRVARKYSIEEALRQRPNLAIQGEAAGPGIQKNRLKLKETSLYAFDVFDMQEGRFLDYDAMQEVLGEMGVPAVEILEKGNAFQHTQESLLALAEGKYRGTENEREGIVVRPRREMFSAALNGRLSFKVVSNRFLLKEGE